MGSSKLAMPNPPLLGLETLHEVSWTCSNNLAGTNLSTVFPLIRGNPIDQGFQMGQGDTCPLSQRRPPACSFPALDTICFSGPAAPGLVRFGVPIVMATCYFQQFQDHVLLNISCSGAMAEEGQTFLFCADSDISGHPL